MNATHTQASAQALILILCLWNTIKSLQTIKDALEVIALFDLYAA